MSMYTKLDDLRIAGKHSYGDITGHVEIDKTKDESLTEFVNDYLKSEFCMLDDEVKEEISESDVLQFVRLAWKDDREHEVALYCLPQEFINFRYISNVIGESRALYVRYMDQKTKNRAMVNVADAMKADAEMLYETFNRREDIERFELDVRFASMNRKNGSIHFTNQLTGTHLVMLNSEYSYENLPDRAVLSQLSKDPFLRVVLYETDIGEDGDYIFRISRKRMYTNPYFELAKLNNGATLLGEIVDRNRRGTFFVYLSDYKVQIIGGFSNSLRGTPEIGDKVALEFDHVTQDEDTGRFMARGLIKEITQKRMTQSIQDVANPFLRGFNP